MNIGKFDFKCEALNSTKLNNKPINKSTNKFDNILNLKNTNKPLNKVENNSKNSLKISKEDLKSIKKDLVDKGVIDKDTPLESMEDLENLKKKLCDTGDVKSLISLLQLLLLKLNQNSDDVVKLKNAVSNLENVDKLLDSLNNGQAVNKEEILNNMKNLFNELEGQDALKNNIANALYKKVVEMGNPIKVNSILGGNKQENDILADLKKELSSMIKNEENITTLPKVDINVKTDLEDGINKNQDSKEEDFLKGFLNDDKKQDKKINKTVNFMSHLNKADNNPVNSLGEVNQVPTLNKATMGNDLIKAIKFMDINNIKDLTVKINPKELGQLIIKITMEAGIMKASITAENKEAYSILNSHLGMIQDKLQGSNLKVQDISLNIYQEDTTFFKENLDKESQYNDQKNKKESSKNGHTINGISDDLQEENIKALDSNVDILA